MKVIITGMTCMFTVALTMGGPIRRQAAQSEKTVPIGGNVTLLCPLVPNDLWIWVYWKKNNHTIYSHEFMSNTPMTTDTRYEGSNHATRLTIKDLKKTESGIYNCKVVTLSSVKELGQVLLSVTDQEVGLSTTSPGVSFSASTTMPPQRAKYFKDIFLKFSISIAIIIIITMCLFTKYRERIENLRARYVSVSRRQAPKGTSTPLAPESSQIRDEEGTRTDLLSSDTHGREDEDVDDRPEESSNASQPSESTQTTLLGSDTHGRDDVDVDDRPEESSNASQPLESTRTDLLGSDTHGRDDVDVHDRPEESSNASQSLKICKTDDGTI